MKTIHLERPSAELTAVLEQAGEEDVVLRLDDGREFVLVAIDEFDRELARTRANAGLMELLDERGREAESVPIEEVRRRLGLCEGGAGPRPM